MLTSPRHQPSAHKNTQTPNTQRKRKPNKLRLFPRAKKKIFCIYIKQQRCTHSKAEENKFIVQTHQRKRQRRPVQPGLRAHANALSGKRSICNRPRNRQSRLQELRKCSWKTQRGQMPRLQIFNRKQNHL
ncbi:hypothetical protein FR483_n077R [Paramecium bursaria Chlorella virus FR483]|uniref:Uncharacterized protein n077R n=1 Tax=Paramecium bursaria Chlorella virus FR483 TaxID=399781 RepID=A7J6D1_PBCVF|nr:hypothetical protein FR483_n077R [Paramecium bursaria Chlorella virus FR483]ABT15362.1 hypothetical protein FR483_n077R [Paramecium bursaria Chlorella virus FR483]